MKFDQVMKGQMHLDVSVMAGGGWDEEEEEEEGKIS